MCRREASIAILTCAIAFSRSIGSFWAPYWYVLNVQSLSSYTSRSVRNTLPFCAISFCNTVVEVRHRRAIASCFSSSIRLVSSSSYRNIEFAVNGISFSFSSRLLARSLACRKFDIRSLARSPFEPSYLPPRSLARPQLFVLSNSRSIPKWRFRGGLTRR